MQPLPVALTIAGSDSGGGAGIQADILTFAACGVFATSAITCLTAQNPGGVSGVHACPGAFVREQAEQVAKFFPVRAVKSGMLLNAEIIGALADFLNAHPEIPYILDPVMIATSGARLLDADAVAALREKLVPRAALVTPNLDEAAIFLGYRPSGLSLTQKDDALALAKKLGVPVLLKGGHASSAQLLDVFATPSGDTLVFTASRRADIDTHGSGCTLAAAVTAFIAKGLPMREAVAAAHAYLQNAIAGALSVDGKNYIAHLTAPAGPPAESPRPAPAIAPPPLPANAGTPVARPAKNTPARRIARALPVLLKSYDPAGRTADPLKQAEENEENTLRWLKLNAKILAAAIVLQILFGLPFIVWAGVIGFAVYSYRSMHA